MRRNDYDITGSVQTTDPATVGGEVSRIFLACYRDTPTLVLQRAFRDVARLYNGADPGYWPCETEYHDIQHVLDVTLAMARLMSGYEHGRGKDDEPLTPDLFMVGAIAALFHDFGYLRKRNDIKHLYGAEYTLTHVSRSAAFLRRYVRAIGLNERLARLAATLVHFTGYEREAGLIRVPRGAARRLGQMLGTADIIAQMADRCYLEKCRDRLHPEFLLGARGAGTAVARLPVYRSGVELVARTPAFYEGATRRLEQDLGAAYHYAERHFGDGNPYLDAMRRNASYAAREAPPLRRRPPQTLLPGVEPYPRDLVERPPHRGT